MPKIPSEPPTEPFAPLPRRPSDVPDHSELTTELDDLHSLDFALRAYRRGIPPPLTSEQISAYGLAELAHITHLIDRLLEDRWTTVVDTLAVGTPLETTAAALGLSAPVMAASLIGWVGDRLDAGHLSPEEHSRVLRLIVDTAVATRDAAALQMSRIEAALEAHAQLRHGDDDPPATP